MESTHGERSAPRVVAVVLTYREEEKAASCLRSLLSSEYPGLEVLLVDNASPDDAGERLHAAFPEIHFLQTGANLGYAGGNNVGIAEALRLGADFVLVLNPDTTLAPGSVDRLVEAAASADRVGAVAPKILYGERPDRIWYAGGRFSPLHGLGLSPREGERDGADGPLPMEEVTFVSGCCVLLAADALGAVGGFPEDFFMYAEDAELSLRLRRAGYRLLYQPSARVLHWTEPEEAERTPLQIRLRDRNRRRLMRRHFGAARRIPFLVRFYLTRGVHLLRYLLRGDRARARAVVRGMTEP